MAGEKDEKGTVKLQYLNELDKKHEVTLQAHENGYYFVSNISVDASANPLEDGWTKLTDEELKWFNERFFNDEEGKIKNYFLNKAFADVKDINIYYLFEDEPIEDALSAEEEKALKKTSIDMELDIHKIPIEYMDATLRTYANLTLEETNKVGQDSLVYLNDFDAYYLSKGDYCYEEYTMVSGQKNEEGIVKLQYEHLFEGMYEVTLMTHPNGYYFVSNLLIEE